MAHVQPRQALQERPPLREVAGRPVATMRSGMRVVRRWAFDRKHVVLPCAVLTVISAIGPARATAAELEIRIDNPPVNRTVIAALFDSADTFVGLRNPVRIVTLPDGGRTPGRLRDLPPGEFALMVYVDENGNGRLDKNFIGIPCEPLGFSNRYWPQGPPVFRRAAFRLDEGETRTFDIELRSVFGKRGLLGVGVGVIVQTSPYRGSSHTIVQPIPAISYVGERLQLLGPAARFGLVNLGDVRLAATASYRVGAYAEDDSDILQGLGDRDDTLMGGVAVQAELPGGLILSAGYEHDLLDRVQGGQGRIRLSRAFQRGLVTASPNLALDWLTAGLADYEYGVPPDQARDDRPAYRPGDAVVPELGLNLFLELSGAWRLVVNGSVGFLPSALTESPIVDRSQVYKGFVAVIRML